MTTLQDRVEAYKKYVAASAVYTGSTEFATAEEDELPPITVYEPQETEPPDAGAIELIRRLYLSMEPGAITRSAWTAAQAWTASQVEILSEATFLPANPFDLLDEQRENQEKVYELISYIRSSRLVSFARKLAKRLEFLVKVTEEEAPDQSGLSPASLRMFIKFLQLAPDLKCPGVVLSPSGNARVQWLAAPNKRFVAEFYPDGEVRFVIFHPDLERPDFTIRLSGIASVESLLNTAEPHGVLEWAGQ